MVPFNLERFPHGIVAAILGFEYGIGVRHGRHCADALILRLLGYNSKQREHIISEVIQKGSATEIYGVVRPTIGLCNTGEDIDRLIDAVGRLAVDGTRVTYEPELLCRRPGAAPTQTGEFVPKGYSVRDLVGKGHPPEDLIALSSIDTQMRHNEYRMRYH